MKKLLLISLLFTLLAGGCAGGTTVRNKEAYSALLSRATVNDTEGVLWKSAINAALSGAIRDEARMMMNNQERVLQTTLAASKVATVVRRADLLTVNLKIDATFDKGSATFKSGAEMDLERIAGVMVKYPETLILIASYTDQTGKKPSDHKLSKKMAANVRNLLVIQGVAFSRIQVVAYVEPTPEAASDNETDRQPTPRLEIKIASNNF